MNESLEQDRDHLLRSLDDLEREWAAGDIEEGDYLALKDDYTARAADVLRALAAGGGAGPAGERPPAVVGAGGGRRSRTRPALAVGALVAFAAVAGMLVAGTAGERLPGDAVTGEVIATGAITALDRQLAQARDLIGEGRTLDAIKRYDAILEDHPTEPEALAYRGWLLRLAGNAAGDPALVDKGMEFIERAVAADPTYPDAHFFRGYVLYDDRNDAAGAVPEFRAFLANDPPAEMVSLVEDLLRRALADSAAPSTP